MWGDAVERVKRLRSRHVAHPSTFAEVGIRCAVDGVRLYPVANGWRHDTAEVVRLSDEASRLATPEQLR